MARYDGNPNLAIENLERSLATQAQVRGTVPSTFFSSIIQDCSIKIVADTNRQRTLRVDVPAPERCTAINAAVWMLLLYASDAITEIVKQPLDFFGNNPLLFTQMVV
jgi:hypothetical protein